MTAIPERLKQEKATGLFGVWDGVLCLVIIWCSGGFKNVGFRYLQRVSHRSKPTKRFVIMHMFRHTRSTQPTRTTRTIAVAISLLQIALIPTQPTKTTETSVALNRPTNERLRICRFSIIKNYEPAWHRSNYVRTVYFISLLLKTKQQKPVFVGWVESTAKHTQFIASDLCVEVVW